MLSSILVLTLLNSFKQMWMCYLLIVLKQNYAMKFNWKRFQGFGEENLGELGHL